MNDEDKFLFEHAKNLYLGSYERLVTFFTLVNTGGIIYIITLLSGDTKNKYQIPYHTCKISFYPLNVGLISFSIALFLSFLILLLDVICTDKEWKRINKHIKDKTPVSQNPLAYRINILQWTLGIIAICFTFLGALLSLITVIYHS